MPDPVHARIIVNPSAAGSRDYGQALRSAAGVFAEAGWTVSWRQTAATGHAEVLARQAAEDGIDIVVAAGGDGTVNEVTNGLVGTPAALAVLPAGTGNVFAAQMGLLGIPTPLNRPNLPAAAEALVQGRVRPVDTGFAQPRGLPGRFFLLWAGIGLDAAVAHLLEGEAHELKRLFGPMAYGAVGLKTALEISGTTASIRCDEQRLQAGRLIMGIVANIPLYAGTVQLTPDALLDDGQFEVSLFGGESVFDAIEHVGALLAGLPADDPDRRFVTRAKHVRILTARPLPVHLDAEPFGTTPVSITLRAHSLNLLVPPTAPGGLFSGE